LEKLKEVQMENERLKKEKEELERQAKEKKEGKISEETIKQNS
jgi:hypothetical protein